MNTKRKPDINPTKLGINPFMTNQVIKARLFCKDRDVLVRTEEGINIPSGSVSQSQLVEEQVYTKVYHDVDFRDIILNMSGNAIKLYTYITYQINSGEDYIWINSLHFQNKVSVRKKQYTEAVHELVRYGVITPTIYTETYFINPLIFFCGNRLKQYPEHLKIRE